MVCNKILGFCYFDEFIIKLDGVKNGDYLRDLFKALQLQFNTDVSSDPFGEEFKNPIFVV